MPEPKTPDETKVEDDQLNQEEGDKQEDDSTQNADNQENDQGAEGDQPDGDQGDDSGDDDEPKKPEMSRRKALRIEKLISKLSETDGQEPQRNQAKDGLNYKEALNADDATIDTLESDRRKYGENRYNEGLEQAKSIQFETRLEIDAPRVQAKYPVLDKDSDDFRPQVADAINVWYLQTVGYDRKSGRVQNANLRYSDFVEGIMELSGEVASEKVQSSTKNIAKQAAQTSLRPGGNSAKRMNLNQAPESMSDEELDAIIGQAIPRSR